jgi:hypothetical protein
MDTLERTQEIVHIGLHFFDGIAVHPSDTIAVIIPVQFVSIGATIASSKDVIVALMLIRVHHCARLSKAMDMSALRCLFGIPYNSQTHLSVVLNNRNCSKERRCGYK